MADISHATDGPSPSDPDGFDYTLLPDYDNDFYDEEDIQAFAEALAAPDQTSPSQDDLLNGTDVRPRSLFFTAINDWRPVHQRVRKSRRRSRTSRRDESRQGVSYVLLKWPLLVFVLGWLAFLFVAYLLTRIYIWLYEHLVTWRGKRERLRKAMNNSESYEQWVERAKEIDRYLGNDKWKSIPQYAYYDCRTVSRVKELMSKLRAQAEADIANGSADRTALDELKGLAEACVKSNFVGFENPRLYSETYYGTKNLVEEYVEEVAASLNLLVETDHIDKDSKRNLFRHLQTNFGRSALCLSGGATFAFYHLGIAKALLDASLLPEVITGTSGGALIAALLCTRTDEELKKVLIPALAHRISACHDPFSVWSQRWWKTGARFDSLDWARRCSWFCRGSMTFREAYERTGRILNVSCVPSDPHSPTILANYLTSPDCVIWSAVLASAAVPGILNPVVLMKKEPKTGKLVPYAFGHKWKDGSLRTDIPIRALNLHFNVSFSIVSQVNPHVNLFFFSSRGSVGRPVTHRRGRGWRGGFVGSATEQYLKLDLTKWLKVLRHLELLPRPAGQDWSHIWLQRFSGTITIWPKVVPSDFFNILADPPPDRLARMLRAGQLAAWPKMNFLANRMKIERAIEEGRRRTRELQRGPDGRLRPVLEEEDVVQGRLLDAQQQGRGIAAGERRKGEVALSSTESDDEEEGAGEEGDGDADGDHDASYSSSSYYSSSGKRGSFTRRLSVWWNKLPSPMASPRTTMTTTSSQNNMASAGSAGYSSSSSSRRSPRLAQTERPKSVPADFMKHHHHHHQRQRSADVDTGTTTGSFIDEIRRQSQVFFDDHDVDVDFGETEDTAGESDDAVGIGIGIGIRPPEIVREGAQPNGLDVRKSLEAYTLPGTSPKTGAAAAAPSSSSAWEEKVGGKGRKRRVRMAVGRKGGEESERGPRDVGGEEGRRDTFVG